MSYINELLPSTNYVAIDSTTKLVESLKNRDVITYSEDGNYSTRTYKDGDVRYLIVYETGKFLKNGYGKSVKFETSLSSNFYDYLMSCGDLSDLFDIDKFKSFDFIDTYGIVTKVTEDTHKNNSADAFNPFNMNSKKVGSVIGKKLTKPLARKLLASLDFKYIEHDYQMRDDNYSDSGKKETEWSVIRDIFRLLDYSGVRISTFNMHSESVTIAITGTSYTLVR